VRRGGRRATARLAIAIGLLGPGAVQAAANGDGGGWGYLIERLAADGVPRERAAAVFTDPRVAPFDGLAFSLAPRESHATYRTFLGRSSVARARQCRRLHDAALARAERVHGVPASVVAALLHVESGCGRNTGSDRIVWRLGRLAMANEPGNVLENLALHRHALLARPADQVAALTRARARTLEDTFYPEVRAVFDIADRLRIDPLAIRGSSAGAFGIPQFLPTSYLRHGRDGNGDGRVSLYDVEDAIASCANYLARHGWTRDLPPAKRRGVLWAYNHSTPYIDTVLALAARLERPEPPAPITRTRRRRPGSRRR
jgi:membrane-bound lytic murein transglycosylase B